MASPLAYRFGRLLQFGLERGSKCGSVKPSIQTTVRPISNAASASWAQVAFRASLLHSTNLIWRSGSMQHEHQHNLRLPQHRYFSSQMMSSLSSATSPNTPIIDDEAFPNTNIPITEMSNEELADTTTIHGWDLIHSPPKKSPRGALIGTVVSDKMNKTVNVAVVRYRIVPKIRKRVRYTRKFMAHDENEVANHGDVVMITPCHRISKNKHFMLREIIRPKGQL